MSFRTSLVSLGVLLLTGAAFRADPEPWTSELTVSDSALDELSVGRYWHAARVLRSEGAASADRTVRSTAASSSSA